MKPLGPRCPTCGAARTPNMEECPSCGAKFAPAAPALAAASSAPASDRPIARRTEDGRYACPLCEGVWETTYCPACATTLRDPDELTPPEPELAAPEAPAPVPEPVAAPGPEDEAARRAAALDYARRAWRIEARGLGHPDDAVAGLDAPVERASRARVASVAHRAVALGLDVALLALVRIALWSRDAALVVETDPWTHAWRIGGSLDALTRTPVLELPLLYTVVTVLLIAWRGQSPGKFLAGIRVVDAEGRPPGLVRAALREVVGKALSALFFGLGYLWAAFDSERQAFHDKIAGTWVVRGHPRRRDRRGP